MVDTNSPNPDNYVNDMDLPEYIDFDEVLKEFTVHTDTESSVKVRVTGSLFSKDGELIDILDTTFNVTILKREDSSKTDMVSDSSSTAKNTSYSSSKTTVCGTITANDLTTDPYKPIFELPDLTDPTTGLPLSYKVTFDSELTSLMSYRQAAREIRTEKSTLDSGKNPGLYSILVETTCNSEAILIQV